MREEEPRPPAATEEAERSRPEEAEGTDEAPLTPDLPPTVDVPEADTDAQGRPPPATDTPMGRRPTGDPDVDEPPD
ncbi:hypothetical protein AAHZ94_19575 [Streptomyces sp. HSW2009]|uniref:hypothetical protein n=1 Tax=Streptomyces sp. HSW2009 TaxID=3142890 RepID=UPI0032EAD81C